MRHFHVGESNFLDVIDIIKEYNKIDKAKKSKTEVPMKQQT